MDFVITPQDYLAAATESDVAQVLPDGAGGCVLSMYVWKTDDYSAVNRECLLILNAAGAIKWLKIFPYGIGPGDIYQASPSSVIYKNQDGSITTLCFDSEGQATEYIQVPHPDEKFKDPVTFPTASTALFSRFKNGLVGVVRKRNVPQPSFPALAHVLFSGFDNGNAIISWQSEVGATYQVQKSTVLDSWENIGLPITGTGAPMNYSEAAVGGKLFLRVVVP
jgi:hypothetical protein